MEILRLREVNLFKIKTVDVNTSGSEVMIFCPTFCTRWTEPNGWRARYSYAIN